MSEIKIGDKVQITGCVISVGSEYIRVDCPDGNEVFIKKVNIDKHIPKPHEWVVGDMYLYSDQTEPRTILYISDEVVVFKIKNRTPILMIRADWDVREKKVYHES